MLGAWLRKRRIIGLIRALNDAAPDAAQIEQMLRTVHDPQHVQPLVDLLSSGTREQRKWAATILGHMRDQQAVTPLQEVLSDRSAPINVQLAVVEALGKIGGGAKALDALKTALSSGNPKLRMRTLEILQEMGGEALPGALKVRLDRDPQVRICALKTLAKAPTEIVVPALLEALKDHVVQVRRTSASLLNELHWQPNEPKDRALYAAACGRLDEARAQGTAAIGALMLVCLTDEEHRKAAAAGLAGMGAVVIEAAVKSCGSVSAELRPALLETLVHMGESAVPALISALADSSRIVRDSAAKALLQIGRPALPSVAKLLLISRDRRQRQLAKTILESMIRKAPDGARDLAATLAAYDGVSVPLLLNVLRDDGVSDAIRQLLVATILGIGEPAVPVLLGAMEDPCKPVRRAAAEVLRRLKAPAVEPLLELLGRSADFNVRKSVAQTLGAIQDERALPSLEKALESEDRELARVVARAILKFGPKGARVLKSAKANASEGAREAAGSALREQKERRRTASARTTTKRFVQNRDGTVTDTGMGLVWQRKSDGVERTHDKAAQYCQRLTIGGHSHWRLPTLPEIDNLIHALAELREKERPISFNWSDTWTATHGSELGYAGDVFMISDHTTMFPINHFQVLAVRSC